MITLNIEPLNGHLLVSVLTSTDLPSELVECEIKTVPLECVLQHQVGDHVYVKRAMLYNGMPICEAGANLALVHQDAVVCRAHTNKPKEGA